MISMMMIMVMVKLMEKQKGREEMEGSSEVTSPVQQGEVRGGVFQRFCFLPQLFFGVDVFCFPRYLVSSKC